MSRFVFGAVALVAVVGCGGGSTCPPAATAPKAPTSQATAPSPPIVVPMKPAEPTIAVAPTGPLGAPDPYAAPLSTASRRETQLPARIELVKNALVADQAGDLSGCIRNNKSALDLGDDPRSRLHLASCESRQGKLVAARADAATAFEQGQAKNDAAVLKVARQRVGELDRRLPTVTASFVHVTSVMLDGESLISNRKMIADPGPHVFVVALDDGTVVSSKSFMVTEREDVTIEVDAKGLATTRSFVRPAPPPASAARAPKPSGPPAPPDSIGGILGEALD